MKDKILWGELVPLLDELLWMIASCPSHSFIKDLKRTSKKTILHQLVHSETKELIKIKEDTSDKLQNRLITHILKLRGSNEYN